MRILSRIASGAVATAMLTATASAEGAAPQTTALLKFMPEEISTVRLLLARPVTVPAADDREDRAALITFYGCSAAGPLWIGRAGLLPKAQTAMAELKRAADWGLNAADFKLPEPPPAGSLAMTTEQLADAEQKLSLAVLKYTRYAHGGRIPDPATQLSSYLDRKPVLPDAGGVLKALSVTGRPDAFLIKQHPQQSQFEKLRQEYLRLRDASSLATAYKIPAGRTLKPGVSHEQIALIRKRLEVPVPIVDGVPDDELYDPVLVAKVKDFQLKNDIDPANGVISDRTRKVLNAVDNKENMRRLLAAMEEWRWMPANLGDTYVWVNVPEFTVRVMKDGKAIHAERVVTGKANTQTPIFSDLMKTVVFQPQWGLPDSIKVNEILPRLRNGGGLRSDLRMQRNGRDVDPYNVNWERANILEYHVFQPSGDDNALGQVKFLFPNKHQVYMHDTPSKGLFRKFDSDVQPWLRARAQPGEVGRAAAGRGQGLGVGEGQGPGRRWPGEQQDRTRSQDPRPHHLLHRGDRRRRQAAVFQGRLRSRKPHCAGHRGPLERNRQDA